jgi:multidrug transporter EmrE-like cation transporter
MQSIALGLAIVSTVAYHLITKLIPASAHPVATLLTAYVFGSVLCVGILVAIGALVTQVAAALALLGLGLLVFKDRLTAVNIAGVALCLAGLWLTNRD